MASDLTDFVLRNAKFVSIGHTRCSFPAPMAPCCNLKPSCSFLAAVLAFFCSLGARGETTADTQRQIEFLLKQNQTLQEQLEQQRGMIESLSRQIKAMQVTGQSATIEDANATLSNLGAPPPKTDGGVGVRLSGEGGIGFFTTGSQGMFPHSEFRVDEARLFLDASVWNDVFFYSELNLATREEPDVSLRLGETYLEFENISQLWGRDRILNLRLGRMYIPFGEEYQERYAIDNPLISHSLTDLWGVDEGVELYGRSGRFSYVLAAQNGGIPDTRDFNSDKSLAGRIGYDPNRWLHVSVSGMRTGNLAVNGDQLSAMWFGGGFIRSLGSPATTTFHGELVEGDVVALIPHGQLHAFGGYMHYGDNDPAGNNQRDVYYYALEGTRELTRKFYFAARFSQIFARNGFPLVANGNFEDYFINTLTDEIWRLSLGMGYHFSQNLVVKMEYSLERGTTTTGEQRNHEDQFSAEAAFRF